MASELNDEDLVDYEEVRLRAPPTHASSTPPPLRALKSSTRQHACPRGPG
jgi:hypothetical protein